MEYLCTIIHQHLRNKGVADYHETRQHVTCTTLAQAKNIAIAIEAEADNIIGVHADISVRVFKPDGGSIVLPLDHWRIMAETFLAVHTEPARDAAE